MEDVGADVHVSVSLPSCVFIHLRHPGLCSKVMDEQFHVSEPEEHENEPLSYFIHVSCARGSDLIHVHDGSLSLFAGTRAGAQHFERCAVRRWMRNT